MSRITHFELQPKNTEFWDYYILCHLNPVAAIALQRMEFWDGTKEDGNVHAEDINNEEIKAGKAPTQDVSRWVYKSLDELVWELMGIVSERKIPSIIDFLTNTLNYLERRNNPRNTWDRKKQYAFQDQQLQDHVSYLGYIIAYFGMPMRNLKSVYYAIESLTGEDKVYIDSLNVELVLQKIITIADSDQIPHFLKFEVEKFQKTFRQPQYSPFGNFAEWKVQTCGLHSAILQNASGKPAESILQNCSSNSIRDYTYETNIEDNNKTTENADAFQQSPLPSQQEKSSSTPKPPKEKKSAQPKTAKQPELPQIEEPDLSFLSEQQRHIYTTLLRAEDQPKYLAWEKDARLVYDNLLGKYGYTVPINITSKVEESVKQLQSAHPTIETFKSIDKYAHKNDQYYPNGQKKPIEKQYYKGRGLKIWDYVREIAGWQSQMQVENPQEDAPKTFQQMSKDELIATALAFPVGMDHTTQQYKDLQNCLMYLSSEDRKEVTRQRMQKQFDLNKQRAAAKIGA